MVQNDVVQPGARLLFPLDGGEDVAESLGGFVDEESQLQRLVVRTDDGEASEFIASQFAHDLVEQATLRGRPARLVDLLLPIVVAGFSLAQVGQSDLAFFHRGPSFGDVVNRSTARLDRFHIHVDALITK